MKKILLASAILATLSAPVVAKDINVGIILGFTGPIESLTPTMAASAEMAFSEASKSGQLLGGQNIVPIRGDSTCIDAAAATSTAERLITSDAVVAIMGADCSGVTTAIANNVAIPNGVVMVSPSATSPALSTIEDKGFFYRTAPSDARQGQVLTDILIGRDIKEVALTYTNNDYGKGLADSFSNAFKAKGGSISISAAHEDKGFFYRTAPSDARQGQVLTDILIGRDIKEVALTYTNNDYGKGLADSFSNAFKAKGGSISISAAHEDGKADYSAEVGALSASGSKYLVVFGYIDQGGKGIVRASIDLDAFRNFIMGDGMVGESILAAIGDDLNGTIATIAGGSTGADAFLAFAKENGVSGDGAYAPESYDAAALIVLAMQAAGSTDRAAIQSKMSMVANAPGKKIGPGELAKALKIIAAGGDVDYQGATNVEFNDVGEVFGSYKELEVGNGMWNTIKVH